MTPRRITRSSLLIALLLPGLTLAALNDTGITQCANDTQNNLTCPQAGFPSQDAEAGRDAQQTAGTLTKVGGGSAGFDFTKLDSGGNPLPASAPTWDCVRDNVTGLIWEIKTDDNGLRDQDWAYTWYNSDPATNGGNAGVQGSDTCGGALPGNQCNTQAYVVAVNALSPALCGSTDWRMPAVDELHNIVDHSRSNPAIDSAYFPRTVFDWYWSASPYTPVAGDAWYVRFDNGFDNFQDKGNAKYVRLVRGGPSLALETTPTSDFTLDDVNGTAYHQKTGLTWKRCAEGQSWDSVNKTCTGTATSHRWSAVLNLAGGGWRLPNINELRSIIERRNWNPAINTTVFPSAPGAFFWSASPCFWSASPCAPDAGYVWDVGFYYGNDFAHDAGNNYAVRLVRDGQVLSGDVNNDVAVNALDVVAVINAVLGIQPLPAADVNNDSAVNALDVVFVINEVLGL